MHEAAGERDYERAVRLRQATFELLELQEQRRGQDSDPAVITALQDVANRLGAVERALLRKLSAAHNGHAPASGAAPDTQTEVTRQLPINRDAAVTLGLAETLVPLAPSPADEAERWLRIMREHGQVGTALEALGMAPGELSTPATERRKPATDRSDPVTTVTGIAARFAQGRGAPAVSTVDLLFAVIQHYGPLFDRALYSATGKSRSELLADLYRPASVR
jgi:hypothetical protein